MGRLQRSWALAKESLAVLRRTPSLIWFPIISGIATLGLMVSFALPVFIATGGKDLEKVDPVLGYSLMGAFYLLSYFVVIFFNSGLVYCAHESLMGREVSFSDGLGAATKRLPAIFGWALIAATVGMILQLVSERAGIVGKIIVAFLGAAWNLLTYFVVPVIVVEQGSPIAALKKSGGMLKKTWGENLIGNAGIGAVFGLLTLAPLPLVVAAFVINVYAGLVMLAVTLIYWLSLGIISASLSGIYQTALYVYAETGASPMGFTETYVTEAFRTKPDGVVGKIRRRF